MTKRSKDHLPHPTTVRFDDDMLLALEQDARENERTVSQTVRFLVRQALNAAAERKAET